MLCDADGAEVLPWLGVRMDGSGVAVLLPCLDPLGNNGVVTPGGMGCIGAVMLAILGDEAPDALRCMALVITLAALELSTLRRRFCTSAGPGTPP